MSAQVIPTLKDFPMPSFPRWEGAGWLCLWPMFGFWEALPPAHHQRNHRNRWRMELWEGPGQGPWRVGQGDEED